MGWSAVSAVRMGVMLAVACGSDEQCPPPMGVNPLRVHVTDTETSAPLCDAQVTAFRADRNETLRPTGQCSYSGGWGPGVYDLTAEHDGYEPMTEFGVGVRDLSDECTRWEVVTTTMEMTPLR